MQKVFEACGYNFTVVTPKDSEPHFIAKELADGLGYSQIAGLTKSFKKHGSKTFKLTHRNGLGELKDLINSSEVSSSQELSSIDKFTPSLLLISSSSLQEYLLIYARKPDAVDVGKKLYKYLSQAIGIAQVAEPLDEVDQMIMKIYPSHSESIEVSKEIQSLFAGWYFTRGFKSRYLRSWNRRERKYNWLMNQSLGFYFSFHWR